MNITESVHRFQDYVDMTKIQIAARPGGLVKSSANGARSYARRVLFLHEEGYLAQAVERTLEVVPTGSKQSVLTQLTVADLEGVIAALHQYESALETSAKKNPRPEQFSTAGMIFRGFSG